MTDRYYQTDDLAEVAVLAVYGMHPSRRPVMDTATIGTAIGYSFQENRLQTSHPADPMLVHTATDTPMFCAGHL